MDNSLVNRKLFKNGFLRIWTRDDTVCVRGRIEHQRYSQRRVLGYQSIIKKRTVFDLPDLLENGCGTSDGFPQP